MRAMRLMRSMYEALPGLLSDDAGPGSTGLADFERRTSRWLDPVEMLLVALAGVMLATFTCSVLADVVTRSLGISVAWLTELTLGAFVWGLFLGSAVACRRRVHFRLTSRVDSMRGTRRRVLETVNHGVVLLVALWMVVAGGGYLGMSLSMYLQPSGTPIAVVTAAIPVGGVLVIAFTVEALLVGWLRGFSVPGSTEGGDAR